MRGNRVVRALAGLAGAALVAGAAVGCAASATQAPRDGASASYILVEVDDRSLPYAGSSVASYRVEEGMLQLRANGTFYIDVTHVVHVSSGPRRSMRVYEGTWTRSGDELILVFDTGVQETATIARDGVSFDIDGLRYTWAQ